MSLGPHSLPPEDLEEIVRAMAELRPELVGLDLFVTGGTGFFGRWLLESLVAANRGLGLGLRATVLSRDPEAFLRTAPRIAAASEIRWIRGSAAEFTTESLAPGSSVLPRFGAVVHLATEGDNARTLADPLAAYEAIAGSTRRALDFAAATGARRFLFTSSGSAYGLQPPSLKLMGEDCPFAPDPADIGSAYALSGSAKRAAEALCVAYGRSRRIDAVIARCFAFSGPGLPLDGKFALGNFLADALGGRDIVVQGDGTSVRSYLYAADLAIWLWTLLARGAPGRIYNVGSDRPVTIAEAADLVRRLVAPAAAVRILTAADPARPIHRYVPSTRRARFELGLAEHVGLDEAIRRTARWHREA